MTKTDPNTFRVERSTLVAAPPERIFPLIADFHRWSEWSPFDKLDPALRRTYGGPASGVGATYAWQGNGKAGAGRMEITDVTVPGRVKIQLDFTKPFKASNIADFTLTPRGGGTDVSWAMTGAHNLMSRVMGLFFSMDNMVGKDFESGLAEIKRIAEAG